VCHKEEQLFAALAVVAERCMMDFNSQDLASTVWVFAMVGYKEEQLVTALAAAAEQRMRDFSSQTLAKIARAFENICSVEAAVALGFCYPFQADRGDHCETSLRAHEDSAVFLDLVASQLGKNRSILSIFDPYFCIGTMKENFWQLGFHTVHNEREDFYSVIREDRVPCHDVLVAGPPYSEMHVFHLLRFCSAHEKPYFLHMPDHVCMMESYLSLLNVFKAKTATKANRKDSGARSAAQQAAAASL